MKNLFDYPKWPSSNPGAFDIGFAESMVHLLRSLSPVNVMYTHVGISELYHGDRTFGLPSITAPIVSSLRFPSEYLCLIHTTKSCRASNQALTCIHFVLSLDC